MFVPFCVSFCSALNRALNPNLRKERYLARVESGNVDEQIHSHLNQLAGAERKIGVAQIVDCMSLRDVKANRNRCRHPPSCNFLHEAI